MTSNKIILILSVLVFTLSCKENTQNSNTSYYEDDFYEETENYLEEDGFDYEERTEDYSEYSNVNGHQKPTQKKGLLKSIFGGGKKSHDFVDARTGLVVNSAKYPANWQIISKPIYTLDQKIPMHLVQIQGPGNLKTFNTPIYFYIHYPNPQISQWMKQYSSTSSMMRPVKSNQQIMQDEVNQRMANSGFKLIRQRKIPRAQNYIRNILNKTGGQQAQLDHFVTEWTNGKGQKALVTLAKITMGQPILNGNTMLMWFYSLDYVFVDEDKFEDTINDLLNAMESTKENTEWTQYMAQLNQVRAQKAAQQHRINMRNRQAAFNAHQQKMKGIWAAQDANHASFMNRTFGSGSNVAQNQFVNMINEEETVYNPSSGKNYQVSAGSTEYWMDSDGNYIKNDNLFYNPNGDINLNNREWTKVKSAF
ncbi:hypothetical protein [Hwangdonia lutea]|uniref:Lipoprotein n=1 Tax=Hwangdonia lutea TaxID=3075823 RepID=A0AA97HSA4_9FLAO|nr:hypothetical protein [Hwangdonia sp. SCSIO 19198]WOD44653.1 hypothetical protein RNZ46_05185 [Hwangdonia sp. SCSIO 19198]